MRNYANGSDFCFFPLKMMKIVEALENKGFRVPLTNEEAQLRDKLLAMARRVFHFYLIIPTFFFHQEPIINYNFPHFSFFFAVFKTFSAFVGVCPTFIYSFSHMP